MSYEFMRTEMKRIGEECDAENAAEIVVRLAKTPEKKSKNLDLSASSGVNSVSAVYGLISRSRGNSIRELILID